MGGSSLGTSVPRGDPPSSTPFPSIQVNMLSSDCELTLDEKPTETNAEEDEMTKKQLQFPTLDEFPDDRALEAQNTKMKKAAGRIVPSRYKEAASSYKKPSEDSVKPANISRMNDSTKPQKFRSSAASNKLQKTGGLSAKTMVMKANPKKPISKCPSRPVVTSTPYPSGTSQTTRTMAPEPRVKPSNMKISRTRYLEHKLLQAAYLDVLSQKVLEDQENLAQKHLYTLSEAVGKVKEEIADLDRAIASERQKIALDKCLDVQVSGLASLDDLMIKAKGPHQQLSKAVDATRHDVSLRNISPQIHEKELRELLKGTEDLLADSVPYIREHVPTVTALSDDHQELITTVDEELNELNSTWKKLSSVSKAQLQETSLFHENIQRENQYL